MKKRFDINDFELATNKYNQYEIKRYIGDDRIVYLPSSVMNLPIVGIHKDCFKDNLNVKLIILNNSIKDVDQQAFIGTKHLFIFTPHSKDFLDLSYLSNVEVKYGFSDVVSDKDLDYALFIDGTAAVIDHHLNERRFSRFGRFGLTIEIPSHIHDHVVTEIFDYALKDVLNVKEYILPPTLLRIGRLSLAGNEMLKHIYIPDEVVIMDEGCLAENFNLCLVQISKNIEKIGNSSFMGCYKAMILLSDGINEEAFDDLYNPENCPIFKNYEQTIIKDEIHYALTKDQKAIVTGQSIRTIRDVEIPDSVEHENIFYDVVAIGPMSFQGSKYIRHVKLGKHITHIYAMAFAESDLVSIDFAESLEYLGYGLFKDCLYLKSLVIPQGIKVIPKAFCFQCFSLERVELNNEVEVLEENAFYCAAIKKMNFPITIKQIKDFSLYETKIKYMELGYGIKKIGDLALDSSDLNTLIILNENVEIGDHIVTDYGDLTIHLAGDSNSKLATKIMSDSEERAKIYTHVHSVTEDEGFKYLLTEYETAILIGYDYRYLSGSACILPKIKGVEVTKIGDFALKEAKLSELEIPDTVILLGKGFIEGSSLRKLRIPIHLNPLTASSIAGISNLEIEIYDDSDERDLNILANEIDHYIKRKNYLNPLEIKEDFCLTNYQLKQIIEIIKEKNNEKQ